MLVKRGEPIPDIPESGPIYVCTRNDALAGIIESTPPNRREDLVFLQNGMLGDFLEAQGLPDASQVRVLAHDTHASLNLHTLPSSTFHGPSLPPLGVGSCLNPPIHFQSNRC